MTYVIDASVAIKWYVPEIHGDKADLLKRAGHVFHAPDLMVAEFGSAIWKYSQAKKMGETEGERAIQDFATAPIEFHPHSGLIETAYAGALRTGQTVYDWLYLALAMQIGEQMITADHKFYLALSNTPFKKYLLWIEDVV